MAEAYQKSVCIKKVVDFLHLEQLTGNEESLNRWVVVPDVNRPGLELSGYFKPTEPRRIVILGNKELEYIQLLTSEQQWERFGSITDGLTPMMVVTHNNDIPVILKEIAEERNFPIFRTKKDTYQFVVDIITFLDEQLAEEETMSGELLVVYGKGVMITGESGLGKSEVALELIQRDHVLIADDRVDVSRVHNALRGQAPDILYGMLEIRGIGIIDVMHMFGANCTMKNADVDLIIHLVPFDSSYEYERVGGDMPSTVRILGVDVPRIVLPVSPGRSMGVLIESAVTDFILKQQGFNSADVFKERLTKQIEERAKEGQ